MFFTGKMIGRFVGIIFLGDYKIRKIQSKRLYQVEVILAGKPIRWTTTVYLGILSIFGIYAALTGSEGLMFFGETVSWSLPMMALASPACIAISVVTAYVKKSNVGSLPRPAVKLYYQNKQYKENFCQVIGGMIGLAVICWVLAPVTLIFLHDVLTVFFGSWTSGFVPGSDILNQKSDFFVRISGLLFSTDSIIRKGLTIGLPVIFLTMTVSFISSTVMRIWVRYRVEGDNGPLQNLLITTLKAVTLFLFVEYFSRKAFFIGDTFDPSWLIFLLLGNFILAMDQAATERSD
ncbi:hypothetical protein GCM10011332_29380 [Terasakiella brassicae]|uniref:Uncharacterized protein n=1 Tax=Terasakiella brassicae TaxID=1634917 RepID=A0A917C6Y0_9PROT|nr:hypothetical protein GCM10011332_29380 [Terasakiella brassicae]